jgi:hypothetical protein
MVTKENPGFCPETANARAKIVAPRHLRILLPVFAPPRSPSRCRPETCVAGREVESRKVGQNYPRLTPQCLPVPAHLTESGLLVHWPQTFEEAWLD